MKRTYIAPYISIEPIEIESMMTHSLEKATSSNAAEDIEENLMDQDDYKLPVDNYTDITSGDI